MTESRTGDLVRFDSRLALHNAIQLWAEANTRVETYDRRDKLRDKITIVGGFFAFTGKHPGEVTPTDVQAWRAEMETARLSPATVYARVSRLSSFYRWLMADPNLGSHIPSNPAVQARPRCPHPYQSESVKALTDDEMNRLLAAVKELADRGSIFGKRDYALLIFYFLTGLRRNEVIGLRGRDLELKDEKMLIKYRRKGGKYTGREVSDPAAKEALLDYLAAADRKNVLNSDRPLWTRHDRAGSPGAMLTSRAFADNLKLYAKRAGIGQIHLHQTRHTFARIVAEETGSFSDTQEALDHENAATTRVYVQRITFKTDKHSSKIAERMRAHRAM